MFMKQIFLEEACSVRQRLCVPRYCENLLTVLVWPRRSDFKPVVFNVFHAATNFATQFNLTTPFQKFPVSHMKCSCVCTIENQMT